MKTITLKLFLLLFITLNVNSQQRDQIIDGIISSAEVVKTNAESSKSSLRTLIINYYFFNNNDTETYENAINRYMEQVEEYSDEINQGASILEDRHPTLEVDGIRDSAREIEGNEDYVLRNSDLLIEAIKRNDRNTARNLYRILNSNLDIIINLANSVIDDCNELKKEPKLYNVLIELREENSGRPIPGDTLDGYGARNLDTNEYYSSGELEQQENEGILINEFRNLPEGTYRFQGQDGHFDGSGVTTITLKESLVNADGYIIVTLQYWSE